MKQLDDLLEKINNLYFPIYVIRNDLIKLEETK